jgi:hypothetical protein
MTRPALSFPSTHEALFGGLSVCVLLGCVLLGNVGCAGRSGGSIVPEENQRQSEERYGEQQLGMEELNQTPSERATVRHQRDTEPVKRTDRED